VTSFAVPNTVASTRFSVTGPKAAPAVPSEPVTVPETGYGWCCLLGLLSSRSVFAISTCPA
jgi:hypothetical protein